MPETRFSLKDHLFNEETVGRLGDMMAAADPTFGRDRFMASVMKAMPVLELKQRIRMISEALGRQLPDDYPAAALVIERALPPPLDPTLSDDDFGDFIIAPFGDYVAHHGGTSQPLRHVNRLAQETDDAVLYGGLHQAIPR